MIQTKTAEWKHPASRERTMWEVQHRHTQPDGRITTNKRPHYTWPDYSPGYQRTAIFLPPMRHSHWNKLINSPLWSHLEQLNTNSVLLPSLVEGLWQQWEHWCFVGSGVVTVTSRHVSDRARDRCHRFLDCNEVRPPHSCWTPPAAAGVGVQSLEPPGTSGVHLWTCEDTI